MESQPNSLMIKSPEAANPPHWTTRTTLMRHQVDGVQKLHHSRIGALFMEMGTGKTRTAIELATMRQGKLNVVVWFCPVSVKQTIAHEILKHTTCDASDVYIFNDKTDEERINRTARWFVVGIESMSSSSRQIHAVASLITDKTMVVCDESTYIKGHSSKRTQRITELSKIARYRMVLTGTPFTQGPVDLFAQMYFLSPDILQYKSFYSFARKHLVYSDRHKNQITRSLNVHVLTNRMEPYVYQVLKKDCLDLPEKFYDSAYFDLTDQQLEAYQKAKLDFADDLLAYVDEDGNSSSIAIFRMFSRLQSIVCGFEGDTVYEHERIHALKNVVENLSEYQHIVIWAKFTHSVDEICKALHSESMPAIRFDGQINESQRALALTQWREHGGYLVATQSMGGVGIDLTQASVVIFYANGFKYSERIQAEDRCHRIGQEESVLYVSLYARCGIENKIEESIVAKENVLERFRREIESIQKLPNAKEGMMKLLDTL